MNEYTDASGVKYEAQEHDGCNGCAHVPDRGGCATSPSCSLYSREDGRSIIWVRQEEKA